MTTTPESSSKQSPLDAAQKIVAELQGMPKDEQALAVRFATEVLKLPLQAGQAPAPQAAPQATDPGTNFTGTPVNPPAQATNIKSFTEAKAPKSDQQFAAVVAYFFQFEVPAEQQKDSIDAATMKDAARLAGRKQVNNWNTTLNNALRSGFLDKAEQGAFKLNAVGENLVAMTLPDGAPARNKNKAAKKTTRKKKTAKKTTTKKKTAKKKSSKSKKV